MNRLFWLVIAFIGAALILLVANDESGVTFGMENSDFARMVYLSAWALVLAPAVLFSGLRLGDFARNLALWLLIALILVAGYQYRYELQDFGNRATGGIIPAAPSFVPPLPAAPGERSAAMWGDGHLAQNPDWPVPGLAHGASSPPQPG